MSIKTMLISFVAVFALAFGMAGVEGSAPATAKASATTPYAQSLMIAQNVSAHASTHQAASVK